MIMTWHYTPELGDKICDLLCDGLTIREIGAKDDMPSEATIYRWLKDESLGFETKYAHARRVQGEMAAEEHYNIIRDCLDGKIPSDVARVVIGGLEWRAKKKEPKVYGDTTTHKGDKDAPINHKMVVEFVSDDG